jgi:hypothetical protein
VLTKSTKVKTPNGKCKLPSVVTETKKVELNLSEMKEPNIVDLGLASGLATKDRVTELESRMEALEAENKALKVEYADYRGWY